MNHLQHIDEGHYGPVLVTLNPPFKPEPDLTQGTYDFDHPLLDDKAIQAQWLIPSIQGVRGITYAGGWMNFGFHEDAWTSGVLAVTRYAPSIVNGIKLPWETVVVDGGSWAWKGTQARFKLSIQAQVLGVTFEALEKSGLRALGSSVLGFLMNSVLYALRTGWDLRMDFSSDHS